MSFCRWFGILLTISATTLAVHPRAVLAEPFRPVWRVGADLGGAAVGAVGGAMVVGGLLYLGAKVAGAKDVCGHECYLSTTDGWGIVGGLLGGVGGVAFGTWGAGRLSGGNGALWATFAGEGAGLAVATLLVVTDVVHDELIPFAGLALLGAVVGYELSVHSNGTGTGPGAGPVDQTLQRGRTPTTLPLWVKFF
jgi:hypothetical protein